MELVNFELYNEDFEWDYKLHFPLPTLEFIKKRTGEDMLKVLILPYKQKVLLFQ